MLGIECIVLIPFIFNYRILNKPSKSIFYYLIISILFASSTIICRYTQTNNMWLFAIMHYLQFIALSIFYLQIIKNNTIKIIIKLILGLLLLIAFTDFLYLEGVDLFNSIAVTFRNFLLLIYAIIYFFQLLKDEELIEKSVYINTLPTFWYSSGIFMYTCASFLFSLSANYFQGASAIEQEKFLIVLDFMYLAGIIQIILFYIGFKKNKKIWKILKNL